MNLRIVYLLEGDAKKYAERLIKDVYKKFGVSFCYSGKQPAHITLKYKFFTDDVEEVEEVIGDTFKEIKSSKFVIGGLGNFRKHALILKVNPSKEMVEFEKKLIKRLYGLDIKNSEYAKFDNVLYKNFHVGIAHHDIEEKFGEIKNYLEKFDKKFKVNFNKVYLVKKPKDKWIIQKEFKIKNEI